MSTDLKEDIEDFIKSTFQDLDDYWTTGVDEDTAYLNAQLELIGRLKEITSRYSDEYQSEV